MYSLPKVLKRHHSKCLLFPYTVQNSALIAGDEITTPRCDKKLTEIWFQLNTSDTLHSPETSLPVVIIHYRRIYRQHRAHQRFWSTEDLENEGSLRRSHSRCSARFVWHLIFCFFVRPNKRKKSTRGGEVSFSECQQSDWYNTFLLWMSMFTFSNFRSHFIALSICCFAYNTVYVIMNTVHTI